MRIQLRAAEIGFVGFGEITVHQKGCVLVEIARAIPAEPVLDEGNENRIETTALAIGEIFVRILAGEVADQGPCAIARDQKRPAGRIFQIPVIVCNP